MADAQLQQARRQAEQTVVLAEANSKQAVLQGTGEGQRILQSGLAEAVVLQRKVDSYGDPRLYSLTQVGEMLSKSHQPLVPQQLFVGGGGSSDGTASTGLLGTLLTMVVAEKSGFQLSTGHDRSELQRLAAKFTEPALTQLEAAEQAETPNSAPAPCRAHRPSTNHNRDGGDAVNYGTAHLWAVLNCPLRE